MVNSVMMTLGMIVGAIMNRFRGGGFFQMRGHKALTWLVFSVPFWYVGWEFGIAALVVIIWPGFQAGWGEYFDMSTKAQPMDEVAWIDWVIKHTVGPDENDSSKWLLHDIVGMSLRGLHFTVPTAIIAGIANPQALWLAPTGLLMGVTYAAARRIADRGHLGGNHITIAELAWGALLMWIYMLMAALAVE